MAAVGYFFGRPLLSKWRYARDLKKAEQYEKAGDSRSAMLTWEQLNRLHPKDAEARRRLASFYERAAQLESVTIWKEAVELDPENTTGLLGLARSALRFGDRQTAREALRKAATSPSVEYYRLSAGLAVLEKDLRGQETNLAQLVALTPDDQRVQLNLAAIRLVDPHGPRAPEARATLLGLARQEKVRMRAVAELLGDLARRWPMPTPERDAALRAMAGALTPARGPLLQMPSQIDYIERLITYAMAQPSPEPEDVISLANWMSLNGQTEIALQWIDTLPAELTQGALLKTAQAEFAVRARDWARLRRALLAGAWGAVPTEVIEHAFRARAAAGPVRLATTTLPGWTAALDAGKSSPAALRMLRRLAELWEWPAEHRQVLVLIARTMPRESWAWRQLISQALGRGDSDQVWQLYADWRRAVPGEPLVQVEAAIMGHLLGRRPVPDALETAGFVSRQPANAGAAVAHALALWRAHRVGEAVAALEAVPAADFNEPRYALVRGIVLADAGRAAESGEMLSRVAGELLLPEEKALVAAARERNRGARP